MGGGEIVDEIAISVYVMFNTVQAIPL